LVGVSGTPNIASRCMAITIGVGIYAHPR
jgi:hypothetical protein